MEKILIIIPAYNEKDNLPAVIASVRKEMPEADIIVINDGSSDTTGIIAQREKVEVIDLHYNLGIGAAMQTGYQYAFTEGYDMAVQFDGDGQHPARRIRDIVEPLQRDMADVIIGSRFAENTGYVPSVSRLIGIGMFAKLMSVILRQKITDPTSGFRAVNRNVIKFYSDHYPEDYPEVEALVLLHMAGYTMAEVPVKMEKRMSGRSSITPLRGIYYMVKVTLAVMIDLLKSTERRRCYE